MRIVHEPPQLLKYFCTTSRFWSMEIKLDAFLEQENGSVMFDVIYQTQGRVFHQISRHREVG